MLKLENLEFGEISWGELSLHAEISSRKNLTIKFTFKTPKFIKENSFKKFLAQKILREISPALITPVTTLSVGPKIWATQMSFPLKSINCDSSILTTSMSHKHLTSR